MTQHETIAAISSALGAGGRLIVRVSGADARRVAAGVAGGIDDLPGGSVVRRRLRFAGLEMAGAVYLFRGPRSYTGEDLVELHLPGSVVLGRLLLGKLYAAGCRAAEPGEFTARAYFNGRMNLTEAEGVAATVAASNEAELRAARQLLAGELARRLRPVMDEVAQTLALVEVGIDFSDEDVTFLSAGQVIEAIGRADEALRELLEQSERFERLSHEPTFVLVGRPNAGKSTLLNALAGRERAVVSPVAGTTRDVLSAEAALPGGMVRVMDAAGMEGGGQSAAGGGQEADDTDLGCLTGTGTPYLTLPRSTGGWNDGATAMDARMTARARAAMDEADFVVHVRDVTDDQPTPPEWRGADLLVRTKVDLLPDRTMGDAMTQERPAEREMANVVEVSVHAGVGLDALRGRMAALAFGERGGDGGRLALNVRHRDAIGAARAALAQAHQAAEAALGAEVVALELREALAALGSVLGEVTPDDLLGRIFSGFCIGK